MQLYIAIDGERRGPFTLYSVIEMLKEGEVSPESLGWHQGRDRWTALEEIPALDSTIKAIRKAEFTAEPDNTTPAADAEGESAAGPDDREAAPPTIAPGSPEAEAASRRKPVLAHEVRPFTRLWARFFDYMLVYTVIWLIAGVPIPEGTSSWDWVRNPELYFEREDLLRLSRLTFGGYAIWHALEAILIHTIGATPGKALFNIRVRRFDGRRPELARTLLRSFYVWFVGFGLGIPVVNLIAMAFSFFWLLSTGATLWDKQLRLHVQHAPIGPARVLLAIAAFALLMALQQLVVQ